MENKRSSSTRNVERMVTNEGKQIDENVQEKERKR